MDLSIISVNWNSLDYLLECIPSIYQSTRDVSFEVIVVDNASPSGDIDSVKLRFPETKLIKSSTNLGFAGANNLGFRHSSGECVLFLNPDTKLVNPAINLMMQQLRSLPDCGIVGCKLLNPDLSVQTSSIMNFPRVLNRVFQVEYLRLRWPKLWGIGPLFSNSVEPVAVEAISGACMLMKRQVFEQVGMFSEDYFMYSEDLDLCYKALRTGFKNYYVGQATIVHYGGRSSAPEWQIVAKTKAELRFCEKHYRRAYRIVFRAAMVLNASVRLAVIAAASLLQKSFGKKASFDSAASKMAKWAAVLKTVITADYTADCTVRLGSQSSS